MSGSKILFDQLRDVILKIENGFTHDIFFFRSASPSVEKKVAHIL